MEKAARFIVLTLLAASAVGHMFSGRSWVDYAMAIVCCMVGASAWWAPGSLMCTIIMDLFGAGVVVFHVTAMIAGWGGCGCFGEAPSVALEKMLVAVYLLAASIVSMKSWQRSRP